MNYPDDLLNKIVPGDCLDVMKFIPDSSIDMILCDLPYGVTTQNKWDEIIPFEPLWVEYRRICRPSAPIILTAVNPFASMAVMSNPSMFKYEWIWRKNRKTGFLNAKVMPLRQHELILVFCKKTPRYFPQKTTGHKPVNSFTKHTSDGTNYGVTKKGIKGGGQTDRYPTTILEIDCMNNDAKDRIHPTQKPLELFEYLIKTYSQPGDVVLDNAIGSGTTAVAALNLDRHFIGIEKDRFYCGKANERLQEALKVTIANPGTGL